MKVLALSFSLFLLIGCGTQKVASESVVVEEQPTNTTPITMDIIKVEAKVGEPTSEETAAVTIDAVEVRGNLLYIDIQYTGGCEAHRFEVIGSEMIAKSLPPIRGIQLLHYSNGDACKKLMKAKLEINIEALAYKQEKGSEIMLALPGWKDKIKYTYH